MLKFVFKTTRLDQSIWLDSQFQLSYFERPLRTIAKLTLENRIEHQNFWSNFVSFFSPFSGKRQTTAAPQRPYLTLRWAHMAFNKSMRLRQNDGCAVVIWKKKTVTFCRIDLNYYIDVLPRRHMGLKEFQNSFV